jgi:hypothetical protein
MTTLQDYIHKIETGVAELKKASKPINEMDLLLLLLARKIVSIEKRLAEDE